MAETLIEWAERVWNFLRGCSMISPGCQHCYAMLQAHRFDYPGGAYEGLTEMGPGGPRWNGKVRLVEEKLTEPLSVRRGQKWFVNSMSDLFHEDVPFEFIDKAVAVMALTPQHTYQILTKRPERMREYCSTVDAIRVSELAKDMYRQSLDWTRRDPPYPTEPYGNPERGFQWFVPWPLPNVWLGVSVENQQYADERIPKLLQTPAAVRFVSYEPALAAVRFFTPWLTEKLPNLDWIIVGGESGSGARPFNIQWARDVVRQCKAAGVACFVKQVGANPFLKFERSHHEERPGLKIHIEQLQIDTTIRLKDSKGGDMSEWPIDLRIREFPANLSVYRIDR